MKHIHYLKIQNFKVFGDEVIINLENPTILIGANNSGKTTTIQALALWNWAVKIWFDKKKNTKSKSDKGGVALNRLEIAQVPIKEVRYFWNNAKVRQNSNDNIGLIIKVGVFFENKIVELGMIFKYHSPDLMYCQPTEESFLHDGLIEFANNLKINLLYPMSGIGDKEFIFQEDAIRTQIGIGQTANVLRNICYHLATNSSVEWDYLVKLMSIIFAITLEKPFVRATGVIEILYNYSEKSKKADYDLDITLAGRGQQQMLLVLAYLLSNKNSILMIDEPDAHLEILRQTQIFSILKDVANKYDCQIILVTHSEVVLNEANSVIFISDGKVEEISDKNEFKFIRNALANYGLEHYYKAKLNPHILYIEGSTDKEMLKIFAQKFNHPVLALFNERFNFYYTQNNIPEENLENELTRKSGNFSNFKNHFYAIKKTVPLFKGIAIFDGDSQNKSDEINDELGVFYWKRYELENYFITPATIIAFVENKLKTQKIGSLFIDKKIDCLKNCIDSELLLPILNGDKNAFSEIKELKPNLQNIQIQNLAVNHKMSFLLENVFKKYAETQSEPILLYKSEFYLLINSLETIPLEVKEKLDLIQKYLSN